ncbi:MAG: hypothetical protein V5A84_02840, partial [Planctomycetota bacterium]
MSTNEADTESYAGFKSPEGKREFSIIVGILGAVAFFAQFVLPMFLFIAAGPLFSFSMQFEMLEPRTAVQWRGKAWYLTRQLEMPHPRNRNNSRQPKLMRLDRDGPKKVKRLNASTNW